MNAVKKEKTAVQRGPRGQQTPYAGFEANEDVSKIDFTCPFETAPHLMVIGPTSRGKTARLAIPQAIYWNGPRVIVSSKADIIEGLVEHLAPRGKVLIMDLVGELDPSFSWLQGVDYQMVTSDPTALIETDDDALAMSSLLMTVGKMGASGGAASSSDGAFWETLASQSLAALLLAGKKATASGEEQVGGVEWSRRAAGRALPNDINDKGPSWIRAVELLGGSSIHAEDLRSKIDADPRQRDSIAATMNVALAPWLLSNISGRGQRNPIPFSPDMLEGEDENDEPTLFILSPSDGVGAGAACAAIDRIYLHWKRNVHRGLRRLLLSIDEAANTAPLPRLPIMIGEGRGLGIAAVIYLQTLEQLSKWGDANAKILKEVFPGVVVMNGANCFELLSLAAQWEGEGDHWKTTVDHLGHQTRSAERAPRATAASLLPQDLDHVRLLQFGQSGKLLRVPGIWEFQTAA